MDTENHAKEMGGLIGNLHTLEFIIRLCLAQRPESVARDTYGDEFREMPAGTIVPESDLTDFASLGQLIERFNKCYGVIDYQPVDPSLVKLRDAIAHGRVFAGPKDTHMRIIKFERPKDGQARIAYNEVMSEQWFLENKARVGDAIHTVARVYNEHAAKP
jgi:hypothetical protein